MRRKEIVNLVSKLMLIKSSNLQSTLTYRGRPVEAQSVFTDSVISWLAMTCELLPEKVSTSWCVQTFYRLHTCDVYHLGKFLKHASLVVRRLPADTCTSTVLFKGEHLGGELYSGQLMLPLTAYEDFSQAPTRRRWLSYLEFVGRVSLTLPCDDFQIDDYMSTESRLKEHHFSPFLVEGLNSIMREWFSTPLELDSPRHGPGAVAQLSGRPCKGMKYAHYGVDLLLRYGMRDSVCWDLLEPLAGELNRTSELLFVPKSLTSYRTICKEPVALQLWQQAVCDGMVNAMKGPLRHQVDLTDQSASIAFAKKASMQTDYVTIDLSAASDSVSVRLVKGIFARTPLLRPLLATRSRRVALPNGDVIEVEKFAPMGSATCFPTQCIIFSAICEMGSRLANRSKRDYRVYGDDIICHRSILPNVLALLANAGFLVNHEKSFIDRNVPFRESCGGEFYQGQDVSPLRLSRWFTGLSDEDVKSNPDRYVSMANSLHTYGITGLRSVIVSKLLTLTHPPVFSYNSVGLWSYYPTNHHLRVRRYRGQKWLRHGMTCSKSEDLGLGFDIVRYVDWWLLTTRQRSTSNEPSGSHHIGEVRAVWRAGLTPIWVTMT